MNINFLDNRDPHNYTYISCFFNLKNQYVFASKKVCYSSFSSLPPAKCQRVWEIHDINTAKLHGIVRNPYSRLESLYKDKAYINVDRSGMQIIQKEIVNVFGADKFFDKKITFEEFVLAMPKLIDTECHFFPQSKFIPTFVNEIYHMENKQDVDALFSVFDCESVVSNKTQVMNLVWTSEMRNVVNTLYYEDFHRFGYGHN